MFLRVVDRLLCNVDAQNLARFAGQRGRSISRTAAGIEHPPASRHPSGEKVPSYVLVPQVRIDFARNHTLACKFSQIARPECVSLPDHNQTTRSRQYGNLEA